MAKRLSALVLLGMMTSSLIAADIEDLQITDHEGAYSIKMVAVVDVPAKYVRSVLTDYVHIYRLNPSITESEVLPAPDEESVRVRTRIVNCIFIFCTEINRVEDIHELPPDDLHAEIIPSLSDFRSGSAVWQLQDMGEHSRVTYLAKMEPDFYIPPIFGSYFLRERLYEDMTSSLTKLECLAKIREELDWDPDFQIHTTPCQP